MTNIPSICYIEYFDGKKWTNAGGPFGNADVAWSSLGLDNLNYRVIGYKGIVLKENVTKKILKLSGNITTIPIVNDECVVTPRTPCRVCHKLTDEGLLEKGNCPRCDAILNPDNCPDSQD